MILHVLRVMREDITCAESDENDDRKGFLSFHAWPNAIFIMVTMFLSIQVVTMRRLYYKRWDFYSEMQLEF